MRWWQWSSAVFLYGLVALSHAQGAKPEVLDGCRGEGCDCLQAYREVQKRDIAVATVRPFKVYERMDSASPVLAHHPAGVRALPGKQFTVVNDAGDYVVTKLNQRVSGLKAGDHLSVLIGLGEGQTSARLGKKTVEFEAEAIELKTLRVTQLSDWMEVTVGGVQGYTTEQPFEGCLE